MSADKVTPVDEVVRLRPWGGDDAYPLPLAPMSVRTISLAPRPAALTRDRGTWRLEPLHGARLRVDGEPRTEALLAPGIELGIGSETFVAESERTIALRAFCARLLGWQEHQRAAVDLALRAIRLATARRTPLLLRGEGYMVRIAELLHRQIHGTAAPFVVHDEHRRTVDADARTPRNEHRRDAALAAARGGTLCVPARITARALVELTRAWAMGDHDALFIVAATPASWRSEPSHPALIDVPPLAARGAERARIVDEIALDAATYLRGPVRMLTDTDRRWIGGLALRSIADVERAAIRVLAMRTSATIVEAAERLDMAPISLARWFGRRPPLPPELGEA